MKKLIFFICFLVLIQNAQAENFKNRFMVTAKAGNAYFLEYHTPRFTSFGAQIDYFLDEQFLLGLDFSYIKYYEPVFRYIDIENSRTGHGDRTDRKLYNISLSGKLMAEPGRFSPFFKIGAGLYIPQLTYSNDIYQLWNNLTNSNNIYEKTHLGVNLGMGIYYRIWKRWGVQLEGQFNHIFSLNEDYGETYPSQYATLHAGFFVIF
ncbi:MAG: porin family protein [candidate division Zixibacteria bacterium]|nr:porin family protein [candidate division Zixibacteria bacterium]